MKGISIILLFAALPVSMAISEDFFPLPAEQNQANPGKVYEKHNIDEILSQPEDDELVRLSGEIIRKLKCSTYLFRDKSGEIRVEIRNEDIPDKGLLFKTPMIIKGEVSQEPEKHLRVEANRLRYNF
ncbi:MAG: NirD/YgiW/YdeI family stress tolerance protein [Endozoicomonas sp.]